MKSLISFLFLFISFSTFSQQEIARSIAKKSNTFPTEIIDFVSSYETGEQNRESLEDQIFEFTIHPESLRQMEDAELIEFSLEIGETHMDLILYPSSFIRDDFRVVELASGIETDITNTVSPGKHYWGMIKENEQSLVGLSITNEGATILITEPNAQYIVHPKANDGLQYVAYRTNRIQPPNPENYCTLLENESITHNQNIPPENINDIGCGSRPFVPISFVADFDMFQDFGSTSEVTNYVTALLNQVFLVYANENIDLTMQELFINTTEDGYPHTSSSDDLNHFRNNVPNGSGNLYHLLSTNDSNLGGVAYLNVFCSPVNNLAYSNIYGTFSNFPTYSWDVSVISHEIGHNLGSGHTHGCYWSEGTIDDCGNVYFDNNGLSPEGEACWDENNPKLPTTGGSIMSYCHLLNNIGINFSIGLLEPGQRIRNNISNAVDCLPGEIISFNESLASNSSYQTITANRVCDNGDWVEFYYDNGTEGDFEDDIYVLSLHMRGQNLDIYNDPNFSVSLTSTTDADANGGIQVSPNYKTNPNAFYLGKRFWNIEVSQQPSQPVGIRFPVKNMDVEQLIASVPGSNAEDIVIVNLTEEGLIDPENMHESLNIEMVDEYQFGNNNAPYEFKILRDRNDSEVEIEFDSKYLFGGTLGILENKGNIKPFVLESFTADVNSSLGVDLAWSTSEEFNSEFILLEKSFNGSNWSTINSIVTERFLENGKDYSFNEPYAFVGETKYRLKMVGAKGTIILSEEITLEAADFGDEVVIYPNPVVGDRNLQVDLRSIFPTQEVTINIYNSLGQNVRLYETSGQIVSVDLDYLSPGTYFMELIYNENQKTYKFVVSR